MEVGGRTLLEITLRRLRSFGISEVIINVHHFADMVVEYLKAHDDFGMRIEISREDESARHRRRTEEGGGFFSARRCARDEPFILHNVDVLSAIDLGADGEVSPRAECAGDAGGAAAEELAPTAV